MKTVKILAIICLIWLASACKKDKNPMVMQPPIPSNQHLVEIKLNGVGIYTSLISFRQKENTAVNPVLLDSVIQKGIPYTFKKTITEGDHLVIRIQGDSTFNAFYQVIDNAIIQESGNYSISGKSTNGKNSIAVFQYPDDTK